MRGVPHRNSRSGACLPRWLQRALLALGTLVFALGVAEVCLRLFRTHRNDVELLALHGLAARAARNALTIDDELGHAPLLGGPHYDEFGLTRGAYGAGTGPRTLFLGDSVTHRARIIRALAALDPKRVYLNAGVEGWNTEQEVAFYLRVNQRARPACVVLSLHNNDFMVTPVVLRTEHGFALCGPGMRAEFSPALYRISYLYRLYFDARCSSLLKTRDVASTAPRVEASLSRLRDALAADHVPLVVLLLPILAPFKEWSPPELESRAAACQMLQRLGLHWIDLLEPVEQLLASGVDVCENANDRWHPNDAAAVAMAGHALQAGLFAPAHRLTARADVFALSAAGNGWQELTVDAGEQFAGREYHVLGSRSGCNHGVVVDGVDVPLNPDDYTVTTFRHPGTVMQNGAGRLDAAGRAVIRIHGPAVTTTTVLHHVCIVGSSSPLRIEFVSNAVPLVLGP